MRYSIDQLTRLRQVFAELEDHINILKVIHPTAVNLLHEELVAFKGYQGGLDAEHKLLAEQKYHSTDLNVAFGAALSKLGELARAIEAKYEASLQMAFMARQEMQPDRLTN